MTKADEDREIMEKMLDLMEQMIEGRRKDRRKISISFGIAAYLLVHHFWGVLAK